MCPNQQVRFVELILELPLALGMAQFPQLRFLWYL